MEKTTIQITWNGKAKKLAGFIAGTLGLENRRVKRPEPHYQIGAGFRLFEDGRLEVSDRADDADFATIRTILLERGAISDEAAQATETAQITETATVTEVAQTDEVVQDTEEIQFGEVAQATDGTQVDNADQTEDTLPADNQAEETTMPALSESSANPADRNTDEPSVESPAELEPAELEPAESEQTEEVPNGTAMSEPTEQEPAASAQSESSLIDDFTVSIARDSMTEEAISNLRKMVRAKAPLFRKSIGADNLAIEVTDETVDFPWFKNVDANMAKAYTDFISLLCQKARNAKRITAKERDVTNERYAMRVFLISLGGNGKEYSLMRKVMLKNLSGSSAFRDKKRRSELVI